MPRNTTRNLPRVLALLTLTALTALTALTMAMTAGAAAAADQAPDSDAILGYWETEHDAENPHYSHVEVYVKDGKYAGRIVWLSDPVYEEGDPMAGQKVVDRDNPDESLRDRPLVGLDLMHSFRYDDGDGKWVDGRIYDPQNGKEYRCKVTLKDPNTLEVFGFVKVGFVKLGRDTTWKRVAEPGAAPD